MDRSGRSGRRGRAHHLPVPGQPAVVHNTVPRREFPGPARPHVRGPVRGPHHDAGAHHVHLPPEQHHPHDDAALEPPGGADQADARALRLPGRLPHLGGAVGPRQEVHGELQVPAAEGGAGDAARAAAEADPHGPAQRGPRPDNHHARLLQPLQHEPPAGHSASLPRGPAAGLLPARGHRVRDGRRLQQDVFRRVRRPGVQARRPREPEVHRHQRPAAAAALQRRQQRERHHVARGPRGPAREGPVDCGGRALDAVGKLR
mmetsp:Transcript_122537/g.347419  ORF Transcript_122537/g.347419 Transcript_122537/m.347419 type:complete len:260 (-) Transcript_122537:271-1050(-)